MKDEMTSMERVLTTLGHEEPDRVPNFMLFTGHGAKLQKMHPKAYFSDGEMVARSQLKLRETYGTDCLNGFFYASMEVEAWGGSTIFYEDGPANSGNPFITSHEQIDELEVPDISDFSGFNEVLKAIRIMYEKEGGNVPIVGVVMSPFSIPVMQMGFDRYFDLIYEDRPRFEQLMKLNMEFAKQWANLQLEAGATSICYFDPVSSPTIVPRELFLETGFEIAKETLSGINGPAVTHLASGRGIPIMEDLIRTGTGGVGVSTLEDISQIKDICRGKVTVLGNLNAIEMRHWTPQQTEDIVRDVIQKAAPGGGYLLSDNHGEIVWSVSHETLLNISKAVKKWGTYPIRTP